MKTITINEFKDLVNQDLWQREQDLEVIDSFDVDIETRASNEVEGDFVKLTKVTNIYGFAILTSTFGDIQIIYQQAFSYKEYEPETLLVTDEGVDTWVIEGVLVVDEDGEVLSVYDLADYLNSDFQTLDFSLLEIEQTTDIDVKEDSDMETFVLRIDNEPNIRFTGELLAKSSSSDNNAAGSSYSGSTGRWTELALYKTKGGKYICHQIGYTRWQGEHDIYSGEVCETLDEVKEFFGHRWLAKELYESAGIDDVVDVD